MQSSVLNDVPLISWWFIIGESTWLTNGDSAVVIHTFFPENGLLRAEDEENVENVEM